jgi:rhamnulokinase
MSDAKVVAAVDLGASSGRVILGHFADGGLQTRHIARFGNSPVRLPDGLHWNILELYQQVLSALAQAERSAPGQIASVGIDTWGVDYGLLRNNSMLGVPFHYRDGRNGHAVAKVHECVPPDELYRRNGLHNLPINTVYQLVAEGDRLAAADRLLLTPDLLNFWLTGKEAAELTIASTTGLLDAWTRTWDLGLAGTLGIPARLFPELIEAGTPLGPLLPDVAVNVGRALNVTAIGSHDTASAVVAVPNAGQEFAYISCGTWGLAGLELDGPVLSEAARDAGFTNEAGVDGTTRFHRNVTGLWLLSESLRQWAPAATDAQRSSQLQQLLQEAAKAGQQMLMTPCSSPPRNALLSGSSGEANGPLPHAPRLSEASWKALRMPLRGLLKQPSVLPGGRSGLSTLWAGARRTRCSARQRQTVPGCLLSLVRLKLPPSATLWFRPALPD